MGGYRAMHVARTHDAEALVGSAGSCRAQSVGTAKPCGRSARIVASEIKTPARGRGVGQSVSKSRIIVTAIATRKALKIPPI